MNAGPHPTTDHTSGHGTAEDIAHDIAHDTATRSVDLQIGGMTCASCAARIERRLNKLDGVEASVNYATELARVVAPAGITVGDLTKEVEACGYEVIPPPAPAPHTAHGDHGDDHGGGHDGHGAAGPAHHAELDDRDLRQRVLVSAALTLPVFILAMVPPLQFDHWQWISLALAAPVVVWGGWPFHRAAWVNLRHGAATMDTLISVGTLAAFGWKSSPRAALSP